MIPCECEYTYGGVKYKVAHQYPGSGARVIQYFDWYFCKKCLDSIYKQLDATSTTYDKLLFNASSMPTE
jgi:hypothetical protein